MATLEDRILGEKKQYYYDSDTESDDSTTETDAPTEPSPPSSIASNGSSNIPVVECREWEGTAVNESATGPKGVIRDWQRYKQLEAERRQCQEAEKRALVQKLALTCRSNVDDEKEKQAEVENLDEEIANLMLEDDFLREYVQRRMEDMLNSAKNLPTFGLVNELTTGEQFLQAIDEENKEVTVIVHLYDDGVQGCEAMNGCLQCLAQEYPHVKFCKMKVSVARLTKRFTVKGIPALLVYKAGSLIGNFVQLTRELGDDFFAVDVEAFLIENGIIHDKTMVPNMARNHQTQVSDDSSGSDFELD